MRTHKPYCEHAAGQSPGLGCVSVCGFIPRSAWLVQTSLRLGRSRLKHLQPVLTAVRSAAVPILRAAIGQPANTWLPTAGAQSRISRSASARPAAAPLALCLRRQQNAVRNLSCSTSLPLHASALSLPAKYYVDPQPIYLAQNRCALRGDASSDSAGSLPVRNCCICASARALLAALTLDDAPPRPSALRTPPNSGLGSYISGGAGESACPARQGVGLSERCVRTVALSRS